MSPATSPVTHEIQGTRVTLPVEVRAARSASATWLVSARAATRWLPPGLALVRPTPGRAVLSIVVVDYIDNDLGDYHEMAVGLFVRPTGTSNAAAVGDLVRRRPALHVRWMPVDQSFTCEAGQRIWGFPKTIDELPVRVAEGRLTASWIKDGKTVLDLAMPANGRRALPATNLTSWTVLDGRLHRVPFRMVPFDAAITSGRHVMLSLGDHPIADELRELGMPRRALMSAWMGNFQASFDAAVPA